MKIRTVEEWKNILLKRPDGVRIACKWIVLRPNDEIAYYGKKNFRNKVIAVEQLLNTDNFINNEIRKYYYDMKNNEHDFHNFERWKIYGRKI